MGFTETVMAKSMSFERKEGRDHSETNSSSNGSDKVYIERSTNFKNWVSTEPKIEASDSIFESPDLTSSICRNGEVVQINKPTISFLGRNAVATKIQKVYRTYRTRRTNAAATRIQKVYKSYRTRRNSADCAVVDHSETNSSSNGSDKVYIERSTNFKNWVATEPKIEASDSIFESPDLTSPICRNGEVVQINKPTISFLERNAAATKIQKVYRTYRTRRTNAAATRIQKVYKSYRTRRTFADCAVVVEELWLKALDLGARKRSSEALDIEKHETTESLRARTRARASGQADKLELQHWLESIDPRHRYGHNLEFYYDVWCDCDSKQPFFYWLDIGDGKNINLSKCPRTDLQHQCISNLGQRQHSRYLVPTISAEWTFLVAGLCLEILSIAFDQAASPSKPRYALFGMTLAIAVLLICIWELIHKGKKEGVVLRRWGKFWWFYYPHSAQTFGTLPDFYGLIGSTSQCICSTVQYVCFSHHVDNLIKVSLWPAIFLVCLGAKKLVEKRNETHGHNH